MKTNFQSYLQLSEFGKVKWLENAKRELMVCLQDSTKLLEELEGTDADELGEIKIQVNLNRKWIRNFTL